MSAFIIPDDTSKDPIRFDATTSEEYEFSALITEHPVETGADVADNIRKQARRITLEGFVSNEPIDDSTNGRMTIASLPLNVPSFTPPLAPTPGSLLNAAEGALKDAITGGKDPINVSVLVSATGQFDAVAETQAALEDLQDTSATVTVSTTQRDYENMAVESFTLHRDPGTGSGATFSVTLKEIRKVQVSIVSAPTPTVIRAKPKLNKGAKSGLPDTSAKKKSLLKKLIGP